jgi:hypothetical protein
MDRFGDSNSAYHFDGITDHIVIDSSFFNVGWSNFTISWWMNNDSLDNPFNFNNNQVAFNTVPHNGLEVACNWGHNNKYQPLAGSNPNLESWNILGEPLSHSEVTSRVWNHFVIQKQNNTVYHFYVNGLLDTNLTTSTLSTNYYCKMFLVILIVQKEMRECGAAWMIMEYGAVH